MSKAASRRLSFPPANKHHPVIWHGADYNPDQWGAEIWDEDVRLMRLANCNVMSLNIFGWAHIEPAEGRYEFSWLDAVLERLADNDIKVVLATPTAAPPTWIAQKYPETMRVSRQGRDRNHCEGRVNYCLTSPILREKTANIARRLASRYRDYPGLLLWHIHNEFGGECTCELCQAAFRSWLKRKYGTLDKLNDAYWSAFWSQTYQNWEQIHPFNGALMGLQVDWRRFVTDQTIDFYENEARVLRELTPHVPVTTNSYAFFANFDASRWAPHMDVIAWDAYPQYHARQDMWRKAVHTSFEFDLVRGLKGGQPFLLMETTPSSTNWMPVEKLKRPGIHQLTALQALAHGAEGIQYFQWRAGLGGAEKFHGVVVDHSGRSDTRVFQEVSQLGEALGRLGDLVGCGVPAEVAIIADDQNHWAIDLAQGPRAQKRDYLPTCMDHYAAFWKRGIPCDVLPMETDLTPYKLVVAPMLYMLRPGVADRLKSFVEAGGTLVTTYWSGVTDENDRCFYGGRPGPLSDLLGIRCEEMDVLYDDERVPVTLAANALPGLNGEFEAQIFADLIHTATADILGTYAGEFYSGRPAVTVNSWGAGRAYYVAFRGDETFTNAFCGAVAAQAGVKPSIDAELPQGVTIQKRTDGQKEFMFLLNFTGERQSLNFPASPGTSMLTGEHVPAETTLDAYGADVLRVVHAE